MTPKSGDTVLLMIDVQNTFFDQYSGDYAYRANEILSRIKGLISRARKASIPIIYVQHDEDKGLPFEPGKPGWLINPEIAPMKEDLVIHKRTPDSFYGTALQAELESRGIRRLIIAGFQTEWCIDTTVRRAYSLEYDVTVVEDAHSTCDTKILKAPQIIAHHNSIFGGRFAKLKKAEDIDFKAAK